ncbi:MAG: phosphate transport system regulator PhoU, partial [Xanthomonadales bacterium]|nr:phosphate transport system regulator PhoU [Xanthomonadales bacterium]
MDRLRFTQHISRQFNQELEAVRSHVLRMGGLVEQQLGVGVRCLREREVAGLKLVAEAEAEINRLELSIDEECVRIMVRRQPA